MKLQQVMNRPKKSKAASIKVTLAAVAIDAISPFLSPVNLAIALASKRLGNPSEAEGQGYARVHLTRVDSQRSLAHLSPQLISLV